MPPTALEVTEYDQTAHILRRADRLLSELLLPARWRNRAPLRITAWEVPDEPVTFAEATGHEFTDFEVGQPWSRHWGTTWFRLTGQVPADCNERLRAADLMLRDDTVIDLVADTEPVRELIDHLGARDPRRAGLVAGPFQVCTLRIHR